MELQTHGHLPEERKVTCVPRFLFRIEMNCHVFCVFQKERNPSFQAFFLHMVNGASSSLL